MPLLEINETHYISASVRLDEATAELVDQYAAFVHASADDVVDKALNYATLRVRKGPSNGAAEEPAKKLVAGVQSTPSVRAVKA